MGGFDPVRDSASASPIGPPRFDPVRDSMTPTPRQESRRMSSSASYQGHDVHMHGTGAYAMPQAGTSMARRPSGSHYAHHPSDMSNDGHRWATQERDDRSAMSYSRGEVMDTDFDERKRKPSRSASIADMLNDNDVMRPGSSSEGHSHMASGHMPISASPYGSSAAGGPLRGSSYSHQQQPMMPSPYAASMAHSPITMPPHLPPPHQAVSYAMPEDSRQRRASPTAIMHHQPRLMLASPHMPTSHHPHPAGSMMPPSPMQESPRFRPHEQAMYYEDSPMAHGHYMPPHLPPQRSPHTIMTCPQPGASMNRSTSSASVTSSNDRHSGFPSSGPPSAQLERSPSLQNLLNEKSDERRRPSPRSSIDLRPMGPPVTPGSAQPMPFAETPGALSSPTQVLRDPPQRRVSPAMSNVDLLSQEAVKEKRRVKSPVARRTSGQNDASAVDEAQELKQELVPAAKERKGAAIASKEEVPAKKGGRKPKARKSTETQHSIESTPSSRVLTPPPSAKKEEQMQPPAMQLTEVKLESAKEPSPQRQAPVDTRVAYKPTQRVSVPTTVRIPITAAEADRLQQHCRNPLRKAWQQEHADLSDGWQLVRAELERVEQSLRDFSNGNAVAPSSKKRKMSSTPIKEEHDEKRGSFSRGGNASLVAAHYNARQDAGLGVRNQSPILPLRNFNNFIKSTLIARYVRRGGRALDLGGGKGGDLPKWAKGSVRELVLADIAEVSVAQARDRYVERNYNFRADFYALDCFGEELAAHIPREVLAPMFDIVSLQFCLHYGWESVPKAQLMLENVARYLQPGGVFVGTIPDCFYLRHRLMQARREHPPSTSFGNHFYRVIFDDDETNLGGADVDAPRFPLFGQRYTFSLLDAVDAVAEYVVDWDQLESLAAQNGMHCVYKKSFGEMWDEERLANRHRDVARRMGVPLDREVPMDAELWEACNLYVAFAFEKRKY